MFTKEYHDEIKGYFDRQMEKLQNRKKQLLEQEKVYGGENGFFSLSISLLEDKVGEIRRCLEGCTGDEAEALWFLYSSMPVSDLVDYPASLFLAYARHGVFLWKEGPYAGKVPEKIFANYVLHHRINNEDMQDTRAFFYEKLKGRVAGMTMEEAAMEANIWCAEEGTYRITDRRDQSPITMYRTGLGRCGEESTFAINVLRSIGIPARQVFVPLWSHCDSNHAWVEAWCDGRWRFFGACEPEEKLDMGWFTGPSTRAMQIHSQWYGMDQPLDQVVGQKGMSAVVNHLDQYAPKGILRVRVEKENGEPVPGARVEFKVLNGGNFGTVATLVTEGKSGSAAEGKEKAERAAGYGEAVLSAGLEEDRAADSAGWEGKPGSAAEGEEKAEGAAGYGEAVLSAGLGSLQICAYADGLYGEKMVRLEDQGEGTSVTEAVVVIKKDFEDLEEWKDLDFFAPREALRDQRTTQEQIDAQKLRMKEQAWKRQQKTEGFYCAREADRVLGRFSVQDREAVKEILQKSYGNQQEIVRFLDWDATGLVPEFSQGNRGEHWKLEVLRTLREKDYWDIRAEVLQDCCICAAPYAGKYPEDVFYQFLLGPRVMDEMLKSYRMAVVKSLPSSWQEEVRKDPELLPRQLNQLMIGMPNQEYGSLITSPFGCFTGGIGSLLSQAVLCVKLYRALGIPARLKMLDRTVEYYQDGAFRSIQKENLILGKSSNMTSPVPESAAKAQSVPKDGVKTRPVPEGGTKESVPEGGAKEQPVSGGGVKAQSVPEDDAKAQSVPGSGAKARLVLEGKEGFTFSGWGHYSLSRFEEGGFRFLFLGRPGHMPQGDTLEAELEPGLYRAITTNRLPNGNQFARVCKFFLKAGEEKHLDMRIREYQIRDLYRYYTVPGIRFQEVRREAGSEGSGDGVWKSLSELAGSEGSGDGVWKSLSELAGSEGSGDGVWKPLAELAGDRKQAFFWLEAGKEPTEHVLNELLENKQKAAELCKEITLIADSPRDFAENETLKTVVEELPGLRLLVGNPSGEEYQELALALGQNPGRFPLAFVMQGERDCIYADSGYNVGMVGLILRVLEEL